MTAEVPSGPGIEPDEQTIRRMRRAATVVEEVMAPLGGIVSYSPLGPEWSSDIDVYAGDRLADAKRAAKERGWIPLDGILAHLGHPGSGRWAITDGGQVLARADLHAGVPVDPLTRACRRALRQGEVSLQTGLEIAELVGGGAVPAGSDARVLEAAARIEAWRGGAELRPWLRESAHAPPVRLQRGRPSITRMKRRVRPDLGIGLSGVDGAGKSTVAMAIAEMMERCGIGHTLVWTRPGMALGPLDSLAGLIKRALGREGGLRELSSGVDLDRIPSRRGVVGWVWSMAVTVAYLGDIWRKRAASTGGVVIFDRHRLDARVTLEAFYGSSNTHLQRWLVDRLSPRADVTLFLQIPAEAAVARKSDDLVNERLVRRQIAHYDALVAQADRLVHIDATLPSLQVGLNALWAIESTAASSLPGPWTRLVHRARKTSR